MTERGVEARRRQTKKTSTKSGNSSYQPYSNTTLKDRSPYPIRPGSGRSAEEEIKSESEESEDSIEVGVERLGSEEMARKAEESDFMKWVQVMAERDEARRVETERLEEARREERIRMEEVRREERVRMEEERRGKGARMEQARKEEMMAMFSQLR